MLVIPVTKAEMLDKFQKPYYGYTQFQGKLQPIVYIRSDLPKRVYESVLVHETQHVNDNAFLDGRVWYWEFRAYKAQAKADFIGMSQTVWMSLTDPERIKLYLKRVFIRF